MVIMIMIMIMVITMMLEYGDDESDVDDVDDDA